MKNDNSYVDMTEGGGMSQIITKWIDTVLVPHPRNM